MKPADPKPGHRVYQMRTMPETLHRRLRLLAAEYDTTLEAQVIRALKIGVESLETRAYLAGADLVRGMPRHRKEGK